MPEKKGLVLILTTECNHCESKSQSLNFWKKMRKNRFLQQFEFFHQCSNDLALFIKIYDDVSLYILKNSPRPLVSFANSNDLYISSLNGWIKMPKTKCVTKIMIYAIFFYSKILGSCIRCTILQLVPKEKLNIS